MTVVAPRPASAPTVVTSLPVAVDLGSQQSPHDFETVLRGRSSRRTAAASSATTGSATGPSDPATPSPGPVPTPPTDASAVVGPAVMLLAQAAVPTAGGPVAPVSSSPTAKALVPPSTSSGIGAPSGTTKAKRGSVGVGEQLTTTMSPRPAMPPQRASASPQSGPHRGRDGLGADAAGGPTAPAVGSAPTDTTAYPLGAPGIPAPGAQSVIGTPVADAAAGRPAQAALPVQAQVLNAVSPLVTTANGVHRLTVHLAPAHLGPVHMHLEVAGGEVTVRLTVTDPATGDAMRQGAAELSSHLERLGLRSGGIDVQVTSSQPTRDVTGHTSSDPAPTGQALSGQTTTDSADRGSGQRDPGPWGGAETADHGQPARLSPVVPTDPQRPPHHDASVDVRM